MYNYRYLLLATGYQRDTVLNPDGTVRHRYGTPSRVGETWETHPRCKTSKYFNHFWVYDTETNLYVTGTKLPYNNHLPGTHVVGSTVCLFAGETGGFEWEGEYYGHHPEFVLKGAIEVLAWA